jgi:uncharacterized protein with HEPN domain
MPLDPRMYLAEIIAASEALESFVEGKTFEEYATSLLLRSAVERQLEIAGEALNQFLIHAPQFESRFSNRRQIKGFRNVLAHEYSGVDNAVVWGILERHLPVLLREARGLLEEFNANTP